MLGEWLAVMDAATVGRVGAAVFWTLILSAGILKCLSIARRETTHSICVLSLTLSLLVFAGSQLMGVVTRMDDGSLQSLLVVLILLVLFVLSIAGLTLGIVGLVGYGHSFARDGTPRKYIQGRVQARWGIALCTLFILLVFIGIFGAVLGKVNLNRAQRAARENSRSEYVFTDYNFRLTLRDPQGWVAMDAEKIVPDSSLILMRRFPQVYLAVIAEKPGVEFGMTTEGLVEIAQANLKARVPDALFSPVSSSVLNGLEGQTYSVEAAVAGHDFSYRFWCYANHGYCYQIFVWSDRRHAKEMQKQAARMLEGFELVDPEKRYFTSENVAFGRQASKPFSYSINLDQSDWVEWDDVRAFDAYADVGGLHPNGTRFCVTPLLLPSRDVDKMFTHRAFMDLYGYTEPFKDGQIQPISVQDLDGLSYAYSNGENRCVEQLLFASNCVYLVSIWCSVDEDNGLQESAQTIFDAISYAPEKIAPNTLESLPAEQQAVQGHLFNRVGLSYYNAGRYPEALEWFLDGFEYDGTNATYFGNILAAQWHMNQYAEGLVSLQSVDDAIRSDPAVMSWEASFLAGTGKVTEADAVYTVLYQPDYRNDDDFIEWTSLRADNGLWEGMDKLFADYLDANASEPLRLHQLDIYYRKGDYQKVVDLSKGFLSRYGFSLKVAFWLVDAYQELGQYKDALAACDRAIAKGHSTVDIYLEKAYSEYQLKWYRTSKQSFEAALKMNPQNEITKEWLQRVSAELGEGDNSALKEAIEEVTAPVGLIERFSDVPDAEFGKAFGAYYTRKLILWNYEKNKELKRTNVSLIKVLDEAGVSAFSSLEYAFNPVNQKIFVNRLVVRDAQGEVVARGAIKDYYVMDDTSDGQASADKKLVIPVPSLQVGYSIEVVVSRTYLGEPSEFYFKRHYLAASVPVFHAAVCVHGDTQEVGFVKLNEVDEFRQTNAVCWVNQAPCRYQWEPMQVPVERFIPGVILGPTGSTWAASGLDYLKEIEEQFEISDSVRKQTHELIEGLADEEKKYRAIVDWIRASFTYKPLEFGRGAFIPDPAGRTLSFRYGDCKDLSVLLKAMLQVAEVDAELVLANTTDDIFQHIATTDQFNHMMVYLPGIRGGLFVDPTDLTADAFLPVPSGLQKRQVLVLDPAAPFLKGLPAYAEHSSHCIIERSVVVGKEPLEITDQVRLSGYYASGMRDMLKERQKIKWVEWFQQNLADFVPGLKVESVSANELNNPARDLEVQLTYTLRDAIREEASDVTLKIPSIWAQYYLSASHAPNRKNPFHRSFPLDIEVFWSVELPENLRLPQRPSGREVQEDNPFIQWETSASEKQPHRFKGQLKAEAFKAEQYEAFFTAMDTAWNAAGLELVLPKVKADPATNH